MALENKKTNIRGRIKARRNTVQALYQWFITNKSADEVIYEFEHDEYKLAKTDVDYFKLLLRGTITHRRELDSRIADLLDRPVDELDTIERAILHIGCYELEHHSAVSYTHLTLPTKRIV